MERRVSGAGRGKEGAEWAMSPRWPGAAAAEGALEGARVSASAFLLALNLAEKRIFAFQRAASRLPDILVLCLNALKTESCQAEAWEMLLPRSLPPWEWICSGRSGSSQRAGGGEDPWLWLEGKLGKHVLF